MQQSNITRVIIINFCQRFHLYIHAYALLLQSRGLSLIQIATIESVVIGSMFLMEVPTGIVADRIGRKWSIVASTFLMMTAEAIFLFARSYHWYLIIGLLTGTGFAFASGAVEAMVYDSLPPESDREQEMKKVMGRVSSWGQIAFFIAPIVGAIIIGNATPERFLLAIGVTVAALVIGLIVSLTLEEPPTDWETEREGVMSIFTEGIEELRGNWRLQRIVLTVVLTSAFTGTLIGTLAAPYLVSNGSIPFMTGVALSVGSLFAAVTQHYAFKIEELLGQKWGLTLLIMLPGIMYIVLALVSGSVLPLLVIVFMYATNDMKAPLFSAYQNAQIASKNRATVLSIINMFVSIFIAVVAPIYAFIADYSLSATFALMGCVILVAAILLRVHRLPVNQQAAT